MANKRVKIYRLCKTETGWKRYVAVIGKTGKIKPNVVLVGGQEKVYPEGHYEIRYYKGDKSVYKNVGEDPSDAINARDAMLSDMSVRISAQRAGLEIVEKDEQKSLVNKVIEFIDKVKISTKNSGTSAYLITLNGFLEVCDKEYVHKVDKLDILRYADSQRKAKYSERTIWNRTMLLFAFLRYCGIDPKKLIDRSERPIRPQNSPTSYTEEEVNMFLKSCVKPYRRVVFEFLLKTGVREQECMYLEWADIDLRRRIVGIRNKPHLGFTIKTYQGREIPLESGLRDRLAVWQEANPGKRFVFGTVNDKPNTKILLQCKYQARLAGLNCGRCKACIDRKECENWFLHKFRATFATTALHNGLDIHTLMKLMGHRDMQSTLRYLSSARIEATQDKINSIFGGFQA